MKYIIPGIPPSLNRFAGRKNEWEWRQAKNEWSDRVGWLCRPVSGMPYARAKVTLTYFFPDKRRRDPDNYSGKLILDGLTRAGIIKDDSFDCIDLYLKCGGVDKKNQRVEIEVVPIGEEHHD